MDFQHAKMNYMAELDTTIRYYRTGMFKIDPMEKGAIKQWIVFLNTCKRLDMSAIAHEKAVLKTAVGNLLYDTLESGQVTREFLIIWKTTIHHSNMHYNKCKLLCEFMQGDLNADDYCSEEKRNVDETVIYIQEEVSPEVLGDMVA
jgi:hypothetical protein